MLACAACTVDPQVVHVNLSQCGQWQQDRGGSQLAAVSFCGLRQSVVLYISYFCKDKEKTVNSAEIIRPDWKISNLVLLSMLSSSIVVVGSRAFIHVILPALYSHRGSCLYISVVQVSCRCQPSLITSGQKLSMMADIYLATHCIKQQCLTQHRHQFLFIIILLFV